MPLTDHAIDTHLRGLRLQFTLGLLLMLFSHTAFGFSTPDSNSVLFSIFKPLSTIPEANRVEKASNLYKDHYRHLTEPTIMAVLDSLQLMAQELNDTKLECGIYLMRADYYSVNRGYNQLSISYHQKAIDFAIANDMPLETAIYLHKKGLYFFTFNRNSQACQYFLQAMDKFKQIGLGHVPDASRYLAEQAQFYYTLRDYEMATPLLQEALRHPISQIRIRINLTTTIGLIYRNYHNYQQAINYFTNALNLAKAYKDTAWIAISTGNIGSVYFMKGDYPKAMPYLLYDYRYCLKYNQFANATTSLLRLTRIHIHYGELKQAAIRIDSAEAMIKKSKEDFLGAITEIYNQRSELAEKTGDYRNAYLLHTRYLASRDSLAKRDNIGELERVKLTWEAEKYSNQVNQLKTQADNEAFKRNAIIFILFLLIVIFVLVFNRFRLDAKRDQEMLMIRKKRVDEKLKNSADSLQLYTENLKQSNALIEKFKAEIERIKTQSTNREGAEHLEKLMQAHIMTDDSWNDFKRLFSKVHGGFFSKLRSSFPYLTDTDMRLLSLIKLGLNNREMANMLGITIEGIKKSKQRLRKKMQLSSETDIEQIVANL